MSQSTPEPDKADSPSPVAYPDLLAGQQLPPPPKQERSRRKRDALLQSALVLFAKQGFEETSIEDIAIHAGVAVGGFYQHFASKRQLLLVLMDRFLQEASEIKPPFAANLQDIQAIIAQAVLQGLQVDWSYAGAYRAWREAAIQDRELRVMNVQIERWFAKQLEFLFRLLLQFPGARQEVDVATLAWEICLLFLRLAEVPIEDPHAVNALVASLTHLIYHGLFAD
ncbi:MAG TPA: TetR/AcrR family transcriptional regulator [Ktedonobacteraceae bacterium]